LPESCDCQIKSKIKIRNKFHEMCLPNQPATFP
jgi:hypothetical protein